MELGETKYYCGSFWLCVKGIFVMNEMKLLRGNTRCHNETLKCTMKSLTLPQILSFSTIMDIYSGGYLGAFKSTLQHCFFSVTSVPLFMKSNVCSHTSSKGNLLLLFSHSSHHPTTCAELINKHFLRPVVYRTKFVKTSFPT